MASSGFYTYTEATGLISPDTQTLLSAVQAEYQDAFGNSLLLASNTPQGVLINAEVLARQQTLAISATVANQINPQYAGGVFLDAIIALTNPAGRTQSSYTIVPVVLTGVAGVTVTAGSLVQDTFGNMYTIQSTVTLLGNGAQTNATVQAVASGALIVPIGVITTIVTNILGWETVNNIVTQSVVGASEQSDAAARVYRQNTLALQGTSITDAITSGVYAVPGVTSLFFQQNVTSNYETLNDIDMKPNSIYLCVAGGDPTSIAQVLNDNKSGGCNYSNSQVYNNVGTLVGSFTTGSIATLKGPFTLSGNTTLNSSVITVASTTGVFIGQTVSGTGIVAGSTVLSFVANTSITISVAATATASGVTMTMGGSPIVTLTNTNNMFVGQTISGAGVATGATVTAITTNTQLTMSLPATANESSSTITMGATPFISNLVGSFTQSGTTSVPSPITGTTTNGSTVITTSTTTGVFIGETVSGTGIPAGATVTGLVPSTSITISAPATASGSITITLGGSPVVLISDSTYMFVGQGVSGTGIPVGAYIVSITPNTAITLSAPATTSGTNTLTFAAPNLFVGGGVIGTGIPTGSIITAVNPSNTTPTTIQISNLVTSSGTETITVYGGIPEIIPVMDSFSGQVIDVMFDTPALIPIAVQVTVSSASSLQNIISVVQNAVVAYAAGNITGDPGLKVGVSVTPYNIAGAINAVEPSIFIEDVQLSFLPNVSFSHDTITIQPFQQATINLSSVFVVLQ